MTNQIKITQTSIFLRIAALTFFLALLAAAPPKTTELKWPAIPGAVRYYVEIAKDKSFRTVVTRKTVSSNSFSWKSPKVGVYFFHVAAIDEDGERSGFSPVAELKFFPPAPAPAKNNSDSVKIVKSSAKQMKFEWPAIKGAKSYEFQLSSDPDFKKILVKKNIAKPYAILKRVEIEDIYWRVRAVLGSSLKTNFSEKQAVEVEMPEKDYKFHFSFGYGVFLKKQNVRYDLDSLEIDAEWENAYVANIETWQNQYFGVLANVRVETMKQRVLKYTANQLVLTPALRLFFDEEKKFKMVTTVGAVFKELLRVSDVSDEGIKIDLNNMSGLTAGLSLTYKPIRKFQIELGGGYMHPTNVDDLEVSKSKILFGTARMYLLLDWFYTSVGYESFSEDWLFEEKSGGETVDGEVSSLTRFYDVSIGFRL